MNKLLVVLLLSCIAVSALAQSAISPRPDETLLAYKARMEAYFAPDIAKVGVAALIEDEGSDYNAYLRALRYWEPRLGPDGDFKRYFQIESNYYNRYSRRHATSHADGVTMQQSIPNTDAWQELGPVAKPGTHVGAEGTGPIHFLTFFNAGPSRMLAGSTSGGLFYSTNSGVTWSHTGTDTLIGRSGVSSAVFHPTNFNTWFAASAGNSGSGDPSFIGYTGGIFRTTDAGVSWTKVASYADLAGIWTRIFKIVINPSNANQLWVATTGGLYVTANALAPAPSWTAVAPLAGEFVFDFNVRPGNSNYLYAAIADTVGGAQTNWRYMYSANNGTSWQLVPGQPATAAAASGLTLQVSPAKADNLYCVIVKPGGNGSELYIYDFGANQWHLVYGSATITMGGGRGFGVDPVNPNEIFLTHGTEGRRYTYLGSPLFIDYHSMYYGNGTYHPDIERIVPHPVNVNEVWMTHHGGVSVSTDNGATWSDRTTGIGSAQVLKMATSASDPSYVSLGLYHDGTVGTITPWFNLWSPAWRLFQSAFCDGLKPLIDPANPLYMWHSCQSGGWYSSVDTGSTFNYQAPPSDFWVPEAAFNRVNPLTQYRLALDNAGRHTVKRTTDHGATWTQIADFNGLFYPAPTYDYILWKAYTPETSANDLIVHLLEKPHGSNIWWRNHLYRVKNPDGPAATVIATWKELPLPLDGWLNSVAFDPSNPDIVYISNGSSSPLSNITGIGMVYRVDYTNPSLSTYGVCNAAVCRDLSQNLPNATSGDNALAIDRSGDGGLYLVTDFGAWYSNDATRAAGNGWSQLGSGLPNTGYNGLELNYVAKRVRVASFGRGAWEHDLVSSISGTKFDDINGNGVRDPGEPAIPGWTIRITDVNGVYATTVTNAAGQYKFSGLAAGQYTVNEVPQSNWTQTFPSSGTYNVPLTAGQNAIGIDFGNHSTPVGCVAKPPDMTAWWPFEEQTGSLITNDFAGSFQNTGTLKNAPAFITGKVARALRFNGTSQYVEVPTQAELNFGAHNFSIDAWVRTTASSGVMPIVDKRGFDTIGYTLFLFNGRAAFQMGDRAGSSICSNSPSSSCTNYVAPATTVNVADGNWHLIAVTVNRANPAGGLLYVDGAIVLTFNPTFRTQSIDSAAPLWMAAHHPNSSSGDVLYGATDIDELELFSRDLTAAEVQGLYKADHFGKCGCGLACAEASPVR